MTEICGIPIGVIAFAIWWAWYNYQKQHPSFTSVSWTNQIDSPLTIEQMQDFFRTFYCDHRSCTAVSRSQSQQVFRRGNTSISSLPYTRDVQWDEVPLTLTIDYSTDAEGKTSCKFLFTAPKAMSFDETTANFFHKSAQEEFDSSFEALKRILEYVQEQSQNEEFDHDDDDAAKTVDWEASLQDFELLGLKPDATWKEIRAAYRNMCKKYHPDRLNAQQLPPHLVELAVERFKEITDAYHRLKDRIS